MNKNLTTFFLLLAVLVFIYSNCTAKQLAANQNNFAMLNNKKVFLSIADTPEKRMKGLMYIDSLKENEGMVFLFENTDTRQFWMKNMKMPIDIVFLNNNKIVKIYRNTPVCRQVICPVYDSEQNADTAVELKAGFCKKYKIKTGDTIKYSQNIISNLK